MLVPACICSHAAKQKSAFIELAFLNLGANSTDLIAHIQRYFVILAHLIHNLLDFDMLNDDDDVDENWEWEQQKKLFIHNLFPIYMQSMWDWPLSGTWQSTQWASVSAKTIFHIQHEEGNESQFSPQFQLGRHHTASRLFIPCVLARLWKIASDNLQAELTTSINNRNIGHELALIACLWNVSRSYLWGILLSQSVA
jgi:hypothetical protein